MGDRTPIPVATVVKEKDDPAVVAIKAASEYARRQAELQGRETELRVASDKVVRLAELENERLVQFRVTAQAACAAGAAGGGDTSCFQAYYEKLVRDDLAAKEARRLTLKKEDDDAIWFGIKGVAVMASVVVGAMAASTASKSKF